MSSATRGYGLLEDFLSTKRARKADSLIPPSHREGRLLDIGCGVTPFFLMNTTFREKFGIEQFAYGLPLGKDVRLVAFDVEEEWFLPFKNDSFDVVTLLAVIEHLDPERVIAVLEEIHRVLKPGGILVVLTPAGWTGGLLRALAALRLVSRDEIAEHKRNYGHGDLQTIFGCTSFGPRDLRLGYFELFMNSWVITRKQEISAGPQTNTVGEGSRTGSTPLSPLSRGQ